MSKTFRFDWRKRKGARKFTRVGPVRFWEPKKPTLRQRIAKWRPLLLLVLLVTLWALPGGIWNVGRMPWVAKPTERDPNAAWFVRCRGPLRYTCVVDGDTIWFEGHNIRLTGFNTPEISSPMCAKEELMGEQAADMLADVLNAGPFSISEPMFDSDTDRYGRELRRVSREGDNIGEHLIAAGLAQGNYYGTGKRNWCE